VTGQSCGIRAPLFGLVCGGGPVCGCVLLGLCGCVVVYGSMCCCLIEGENIWGCAVKFAVVGRSCWVDGA